MAKKGARAPAPTQQHATKNDVEMARIQSREKARVADLRYGLGRTVVRVAAFVAVAYFFFKAAQVYAGTDTRFKAVFDGVISLSADRWVAYILAGITTGAWYRLKKLRERTISEQGTYIKQLESKVDPHRSSSGLTKTGKPRKEDLDAP